MDSDLSNAPPGENWDYLDKDSMALLSDNHLLCVSPNGFPQASLVNYLRRLMEESGQKGADIPKEFLKFNLTQIANADITEQIQQEGIKKIDLNMGQFRATTDSQIDDRPETITKKLGRVLWDELVTGEQDRRMIEEADNVSAKLVITLDSRKPGLKPEDLADIATEISSEEEDAASFVTGKGNKIKQGELLMTKTVKLSRADKTVSYNEAWEQMEEFLLEMSQSGKLEL